MSRFSKRHFVGLSVAVLLLSSALGCGSGDNAAGVTTNDYTVFRSLAGLYVNYQSQHNGKTPDNEQEFRDFLQTKQAVLSDMELSVDQLLTSPRNGKPLQVVCGRQPPAGPNGMRVIAYESEPVEGKRLVIAPRGMYEVIDETEFQKFFPEAE